MTKRFCCDSSCEQGKRCPQKPGDGWKALAMLLWPVLVALVGGALFALWRVL